MLKKIMLGVLAIVAGIYVWNASWRVAPPEGGVQLIAHRGVHQTYHREGLTNDTCTAVRIDPPTHGFIENTLPSMAAAFDAGADIIELDVHPTTDGQLAVMHDWTVDCRTEGTGETRSHDMAYLKTLDLGFGYTADGGRTFPFRGAGVGLMPELQEVFSAFPEGNFLVNYKSNEALEGDMLAAILTQHPEWRGLVWGVYGGGPPTHRALQLIGPGEHGGGPLVAFSSRDTMQCLLQYLGLGWTGYVPDICRNTAVLVPVNYAWLLWGWPNLFIERMQAEGSAVVLLGPYENGDPGAAGIDSAEQLAEVPQAFSGYLWTNKIESIGPLARDRFK